MLTVSACASSAGGTSGGGGGDGDRPDVVVTTTILGDVVRQVVGDAAEVQVLMPVGADPHEFSASTRQAEAMAAADLLVVQGGGFEQALGRVIDAARHDGTPVFAVADHVDLLAPNDPHVWTDPVRMASAVDALGATLAGIDGMDPGVTSRAASYAAQLRALDGDIRAMVAGVPPDRRVLVTNHDVFAYFADRYGFEVLGAVVPSLSTAAGASPAGLEDLAHLIAARHVPAIFAETTRPTALAEALADEVGAPAPVAVIELYTESLGEPGSGADTYLGLLRTDAQRITGALVQA